MASSSEEQISRTLRAILAKLPDSAGIPDSEQFREVLSGLEYFLPEVLGEIHPEWKEESLDGVLPIAARKTGDGEAEILGAGILISDQTLTPLHLRFRIAAAKDEVSWLECKLGERGERGMVRTPYDNIGRVKKRLYGLESNPGLFEWVYKVTFGDRRP